jgi:molybdenum cofactor cytidylyltransferase
MIPAIILAAGASSRMGQPKALLQLGSETFLARICRTMREAGVDSIVIVTGPELVDFEREPSRYGINARVVANPGRDAGQLSSLQVGLDAIDGPEVEGALVHLVDAPGISADTVRAILDGHRRTGAAIVRPLHATRHGHPVLRGSRARGATGCPRLCGGDG